MRGVKPKDVIWGVVIVSAFLLAYYVLYLLSFIYLRPYINYYLSIINSSRVRVFNLAMLVIFLSSPFNAYEAKILHTNPTTYFIKSVIKPTILMFIFLIFYYYAMVKRKVRPIIRPIDFTIFAIAASLLDSWIVSLIIWMTLGVPSIGTSIYAVFQFTAAAYIAAYILLIIITQTIRVIKSLRDIILILSKLILIAAAMVAFALLVYIIFTRYIPIMNVTHAMGLVVALISIGIYHVSKTTTLSLKVKKLAASLMQHIKQIHTMLKGGVVILAFTFSCMRIRRCI